MSQNNAMPDPLRYTSADEAVKDIRSGQRVLVGSGCAEPQHLVRALCRRAGSLHDVEIVHLLTLGLADYVEESYESHFRHNAFFIGPNVREAVRRGRADYTPIFLSQIPDLLRGRRRIDVALLQLAPPDADGVCSMGIHVDIQRAAVETASLVLAEINPRMPRTHGDSGVRADRIHRAVRVDEPLLELPGSSGAGAGAGAGEDADEASRRIGILVARLIEHGSCLQLGIGKIPDAVLAQLDDKRDLGVHTEMFSDGLPPLIENGNVTNRQKSVLPGKTVTSFCMGSRKLYDFLDDNESVHFAPSDFVNDPRVICRNERVVAVNSALQVDLTGQVCADSLGYRFFSGIGGQVDFIRGAAMSRGGKPIIALPSTAKGGTVSRIVARLDEGAGVVTSRGDTHYVVTEYGIAYLHGKTVRERALALIQIAHPDFRRELYEFVRQKSYVYDDEAVWQRATEPYPAEWEREVEFGGAPCLIRPLKASDRRRLQEFFYSHEPETVFHRHFSYKRQLGQREALELCCVDYGDRMAFGVFPQDGSSRLVAVGRYYLNPPRNMAETAIVVHEDWRRRGIAAALTGLLHDFAVERGIDGFYSEILPSNRAMVEMHRKQGHTVRFDPEEKVYQVSWRFSAAGTS